MYTLATLHQLRQRLGLAAADTADDVRLLAALQAASAGIERAAGRRFSPRRAVRVHDFSAPAELLLTDDLLELIALTNGDGASILLNDVLRLPAEPPAALLRLTGGLAFTWDDTPYQAIGVTGLWGWHDRWTEAWRGSGDSVQNNPLSVGATAITVTDADGVDAFGESPRFQVGHLLKIEDEYLRVLAVNTTSNALTVLRGVSGTTAASHAQGTSIALYQPPAEIAALAQRWASWLYREPDTAAFVAAPAPLLEALAPFRRLSVMA